MRAPGGVGGGTEGRYRKAQEIKKDRRATTKKDELVFASLEPGEQLDGLERVSVSRTVGLERIRQRSNGCRFVVGWMSGGGPMVIVGRDDFNSGPTLIVQMVDSDGLERLMAD